MLILANTTDKLEINLGGTVDANQLQVVTSWRDVTATTYTPGRTAVLSNNATDVDISGSPGASTQRVIDHVNVYNADTAAATVTITYDANGTEYVLHRTILAPLETLTYSEGVGWVKLGGYLPTIAIPYNGQPAANWALTDSPIAERFAGNSARHAIMADLAGYSQVRLQANVMVDSVSVNTPAIRLRYYTGYSTTFANYLQLGASGHVSCSLFTGTANTRQDSGWIDLAAGAKINGCSLALCEVGGNAAADPAIGNVMVFFR